MQYRTVIDTIDAINKDAAMLNVTPNGGVFTRKQFNNAGCNRWYALDTMRKHNAVVIDHVETFTVPARANISIRQFDEGRNIWRVVGSMNVCPEFPDYINIENVVYSGKFLNALVDFDEDVRAFLCRCDIDLHNCSGVSVNGDCSAFFFSNDTRVNIVFHPEYEGHRNFYRFNLDEFVKRGRTDIMGTAEWAERKAKQLAQESEERKFMAVHLRSVLANIDRMS